MHRYCKQVPILGMIAHQIHQLRWVGNVCLRKCAIDVHSNRAGVGCCHTAPGRQVSLHFIQYFVRPNRAIQTGTGGIQQSIPQKSGIKNAGIQHSNNPPHLPYRAGGKPSGPDWNWPSDFSSWSESRRV